MHQLKVLILGPASFTTTLNEIEPFLKFNSIKEKKSSNFDIILFCVPHKFFQKINQFLELVFLKIRSSSILN